MKIFDLPTPALIADEELMDGNMRAMADLLKGKKAGLRPHYKSHKCAAIAHRQIALGAVGVTCAKLSEAEDLVFSGVEDVLIANQVVGRDRIRRLAALAGMCRLTVCVDDADNARALSEAAVSAGSRINCLVEYDIGMNRCGVRTPEEYMALARTVCGLPSLAYEGVQAYAGYASHMASAQARAEATQENERKVRELIGRLRADGIDARTVSGGSTGTAALKADGGVYTEIQAGSYFFMDSTYGRLGLPFRNALFVLSTVVSRRSGAAILDTGVKSLGTDQDDPVVLRADGTLVSGRCEPNEEHLKLYGPSQALALGEKVFVIPGHCCSTVNLYDNLYLFQGDRVTDRLTVTARGRSQ